MVSDGTVMSHMPCIKIECNAEITDRAGGKAEDKWSLLLLLFEGDQRQNIAKDHVKVFMQPILYR